MTIPLRPRRPEEPEMGAEPGSLQPALKPSLPQKLQFPGLTLTQDGSVHV